jgi:hypothetical protein
VIAVNTVFFLISLLQAILLLLTFNNRMYLVKWVCLINFIRYLIPLADFEGYSETYNFAQYSFRVSSVSNMLLCLMVLIAIITNSITGDFIMITTFFFFYVYAINL